MSRLTTLLEENDNMMASMKAEVPIKVIGKERIGNKGRPTWPMYVWVLLLEHGKWIIATYEKTQNINQVRTREM